MVLRQFAEHAPDPAVLTRRHVRAWQEAYVHLSQSTKRNRLTVVRKFCRWLHEERHCPCDPCKGVQPLKEPKRIPRALPSEQVAAVLEACPDTRSQLASILMVQECLRRGEVARLEVGDFDLRNRLLLVHGKGGKQRVVYITDEVHRILLRYLAETGAIAGPLLRSYQFPNRGLHEETVSTMVRRAMYAAGVKKAPRDGVHPHCLRHTGLTDILRGGASIRDVQAVAGHEHSSTTEVYLPLMVGTMQEAMEGRSYGT